MSSQAHIPTPHVDSRRFALRLALFYGATFGLINHVSAGLMDNRNELTLFFEKR